jgi:putative ABC transport system ATP-binding protein
MPLDTAAVEAIGLSRTHRVGRQTIQSLTNVSLTVAHGEIVAVMGPSGSGKSTLLHLLGGLDDPDQGKATIIGVDWRTLRGKARARFRHRACGFVTQTLALLPQATAAENVEAALLLGGVEMCERRSRTTEALERVGLANERAKLPDQLSGGQQQRVAIARALVTRPAVLLADEPTGNLDSATAEAIAELLVTYASEQHAAVVLVTHDPVIAAYAHRIVALHSGHIGVPVARKRVVRRVRAERGRQRREYRRTTELIEPTYIAVNEKDNVAITEPEQPAQPAVRSRGVASPPTAPVVGAAVVGDPVVGDKDSELTQRIYPRNDLPSDNPRDNDATQRIDPDQTQRIVIRPEQPRPGGTP